MSKNELKANNVANHRRQKAERSGAFCSPSTFALLGQSIIEIHGCIYKYNLNNHLSQAHLTVVESYALLLFSVSKFGKDNFDDDSSRRFAFITWLPFNSIFFVYEA